MDRKCLSGLPLIFLTFALGLGTFIQILDTSIANVSIPAISGELGSSPNEGTWVITSFAVSNAIVLPLTGWLVQLIGAKRLFVGSTILFSLFSWLCGLSTSLAMLITFRIFQGAVAGCLIPLSQGMLLQNYPEEKQGLALGLWSMVVVVAPVVGPILGGWITDNYGWSWIFYINIPIGLLSAWITAEVLHGRKDEHSYQPIDITGLVLLILGIGCLQIMLDKGNDLDWFESSSIVTLACISALSSILFIAWSAFSQYPVVNLSFFKSRNFSVATFVSGVGYLLFFGSMVLLPLWLQTQMGYTAYLAGWALMPIGLIPIIVSPFVGKYMYNFDLRILASVSFLIFSFTSFWYSTFTTDVSLFQIIMPRLIQGFAVTIYFLPLVALSLTDIPRNQISSASGVFNFIRLVAGGGIGTALFVTFWDRRADLHHSQLGESITSFSPATDQFYQVLGELGIMGSKANAVVNNLLDQQAYMISINEIFWLTGWLYFLLIPFVWLCHPAKNGSPAHASAE